MRLLEVSVDVGLVLRQEGPQLLGVAQKRRAVTGLGLQDVRHRLPKGTHVQVRQGATQWTYPHVGHCPPKARGCNADVVGVGVYLVD